MTVQLINIGNVANDGTGDDLREAFIKANANFEGLDLRDDEQTSGLNIGFGQGSIFKQKIGYELQFKTLSPGTDVTFADVDDVITITADGGIKTLALTSDNSTYTVPDIGNLQILGGANIGTTIIDGKLYVSYNGPTQVVDDTTPTLSGNLDADSNNISNVATLTAENVVGLVHGIDIRDNSFSNLDLGEIVQNITTSSDFFLANNDVDYGSIEANASTIHSDFGTLV
jgi:hypothetical protein